jgi:hypothetical protein
MGTFHAEPGVLAPGRWARSPRPHAADGERGQHGAALEDLQDRAAAETVMVNRGGGECEPLFKSATAGHGCLLLEWDVLRYVVM